ncbi:MAG: Rieske 2Fe-2S domain-containing protein [Caldilineaceae bacterium]|nr:Rieske 2Fe-2S domain-containing protein [Caldilineaceae bacterium]
MPTTTPGPVRAAYLSELEAHGQLTVTVGGHTLALFRHQGRVHAIDNRCPHMGFPLDRGSLCDGILTCHWHHARFDLNSGGSFDLWADDVPAYPVEVRDGAIWVDLTPPADARTRQRDRLEVGLEQEIPLIVAKAVLSLMEESHTAGEPFRAGLAFGTRYRDAGWGQGLTMLTCFANMTSLLDADDRPRALYQGLSAVARDTAGRPPRFPVRPLPGTTPDAATLKRWFRQFVEVRDGDGAERCIVSALRAGMAPATVADMLFAAVTDHRYINVGHPLDFTNKALEALDATGWENAELVLTSLVRGYAMADRMEESNAWRHPIDLVAILEAAFERLPDLWDHSTGNVGAPDSSPLAPRPSQLLATLLGDDPQAVVDALLAALEQGHAADAIAQAVAYAAALRIARFHTSNEFGDWDTALHTFTFANAVHQGLRRAPSPELLRGVFDAAISVYLDRFLNTPAARLPEPQPGVQSETLLADLAALLDRQQQVNAAAQLVVNYLATGADPQRLLATIGRLLLREDRDFHTIQAVEGAFRQYSLAADATQRAHFLVAAVRYLAAHAPTVRSQGQTYQIALRLHRGEALFEG